MWLAQVFALLLVIVFQPSTPAFAVLECPKADDLDDSRESHDDDKQDNRFREECLQLDNVEGIKPPACMHSKDTNHHFAPIVNKFLYQGAKFPTMVYRAYNSSEGTRYGSVSYRENAGLFGVGGCTPIDLDPQASKGTIRAAYNKCANEYILALRHNPNTIFEAQGEIPYKDDGGCPALPEEEQAECELKHIDPTDCQPLAMEPLSDEDNEEVDVQKYLTDAASKLGVSLQDGDPDNDSDSDGNKTNDDLPKTINDLIVPFDEETYERIYDPSHPFSPRHDFLMNERMLSYIVTAPFIGYESERQDEPSENKCAVACASVPVDIMSFRMQDYGICIGGRMMVNILCNMTKYLGVYDWCHEPLLDAGTFPPCSTRYDVEDNLPGVCEAFGKIDECCEKLRKPVPMINVLKLREYTWQNFAETEEGHKVTPDVVRFKKNFGTNMPYMRWWDTGRAAGHTSGTEEQDPLNTLGSEDAIVGIGREAPKDSDAGASLCRMAGPAVKKNSSSQANALAAQLGANIGTQFADMISSINVDVIDQITSSITPPTLDSDFAEDMLGSAMGQMQGMGDQVSQVLGGFASQIGQQLKNKPNGDLDWMEYKLYQARTIRYHHLACLGRYEKLWKKYSSEELALAQLSKSYDIMQISDEELDAMSEEEQKRYRDVRAISGIWPFGWRGYAGAHFPNSMFPVEFRTGDIHTEEKGCHIENGCPRDTLDPYKYLVMGLDKARRGDIIVYNHWLAFRTFPGEKSLMQRVPTVAYIAETPVNKETYKDNPDDLPEFQYVDVIEWNNGKIPDVCGNTEALASTGSTRRLYKKKLPLKTQLEHGAAEVPGLSKLPLGALPGANYGGSCYDPDLKECIEPLWDNIMFYRPRHEIRGYTFDDYSIGNDTSICSGDDGKMDDCTND